MSFIIEIDKGTSVNFYFKVIDVMYVLPLFQLAKLTRYEEEQKKAAEVLKAKEDKSKEETSTSTS